MSAGAPRPAPNAGEARPVEVLVIAGYPAVRAGLAALLAQDPGIVTVAAGPPGALERTDAGPELVVVDLAGMPEDAADDLASAYPTARFVILGANPAVDGPGLAAGPVAYLTPDADAATLVAAVRGVAAGLTVLDPALVAGPAHPLRGETPATAADLGQRGEPLTPREREVLELVANGLPNKAIARDLGISEHTAKFHVGSLLTKLGAGSRTEAVTIATRRGLLHV